MLFAIHMTDRPHAKELRKEHSLAHREFVGAFLDRMYCGGPLLTDEGAEAIGSLIIMEFEDRSAAEAFIASEPYNRAGLFESVIIRNFGPVVPPGGSQS